MPNDSGGQEVKIPTQMTRALLSRATKSYSVYLIVAVLATAGCATTRIEQSRQNITELQSGEALVVLGRATYNDRETEESFTNCLVTSLAQGDNPIRLVSED